MHRHTFSGRLLLKRISQYRYTRTGFTKTNYTWKGTLRCGVPFSANLSEKTLAHHFGSSVACLVSEGFKLDRIMATEEANILAAIDRQGA